MVATMGRRLSSTFSWMRGRVARQALEIHMYQALALVGGLAMSVIIARSLGPAGKGAIDLFIVATGLIVQFGMLGIAQGFLYELANRSRPLAEVHGNSLVYAISLGTLGVGLAATAPWLIGWVVGALDESYVILALVMTGVLAYVHAFANVMIGVDRAPTTYRVRALFGLFNTTVVAILWAAGRVSVDLVVMVIAGSWVLQALVQFTILRRIHRGHRITPTLESLRSSFRYGLRSFPGGVANWIHYRIDQIVIAAVIGLAGAGIYALSVRWAEMLGLIAYGLLSASLHRISSSDALSARAFTWRLFKVTILLLGGGALALAVVAAPLLGVLYGPQFVDAVLPLILLLPGVVALAGGRVLSTFVAYNRGRPEIPTAIFILAAGLNLAGTLAVVPRFGLAGAALVSTSTYILVLILNLAMFRRLAGQGELDIQLPR